MRVLLEMTGTSPLLMHNPQLADPANSWTRAIAEITAKGKKMTDKDQQEKLRLEFMGGLYVGAKGVVVPAKSIRKCLILAARITRKGKDIERALITTSIEFPLIYKGPREPTGLWADEQHRYLTLVKVGRGLVPRMRPQFPRWSLVSEWEIETSILNLRDFIEMASKAGVVEGIGDNRVNGFGRFTTQVSEAVDEISHKAA